MVYLLTYLVLANHYFSFFWIQESKLVTVQSRFKRHFRNAILLGSLAAALFAFGSFRAGPEAQQETLISGTIPGPILYANAFFAQPFQNFADFYRDYHGLYYPGVGFFRPVLSIIGAGQYGNRMTERINFEYYLRAYPANTFPFITYLYAESGIAGTFLFSCFYALLVNFVYVRFRNKPNFFWLISYIAAAGTGWAGLFSSNPFQTLIIPANICCAGLLYKFVVKRTV
jgi:oligosaccharide repeat unit polymerase